MKEECRCAKYGIPDGWLCGDPNCPRTRKFEGAMKPVLEELANAVREQKDEITLDDLDDADFESWRSDKS